MKKIEKAVCWICNHEYESVTEAKKCEAKGLMAPYFMIGDTITYQKCLGSDRDGPNYTKRTGTIIDILFPVPQKKYLYGHALSHKYHASYLVKCESSVSWDNQFFNQENIELLQILRTVEVVSETSMFFEDGTYISGESDPKTNRSRRTVVMNWDDYVSEIKRRNPQLKDRLIGLTKRLRGLGCLDSGQ